MLPPVYVRQVCGYQGRTNKDADSCYSFWIGASLSLLDQFNVTDVSSTKEFVLDQCQFLKAHGGFCKNPESYPDLLHTFYSIAWLSMVDSNFNKIDPRLGICLKRLK